MVNPMIVVFPVFFTIFLQCLLDAEVSQIHVAPKYFDPIQKSVPVRPALFQPITLRSLLNEQLT